jgi:hypothetical protein
VGTISHPREQGADDGAQQSCGLRYVSRCGIDMQMNVQKNERTKARPEHCRPGDTL